MAKNKIKDSYKKFDVISIHDIPDCSSTGIYLRHRATGLEVFHLLNDDEENLFAFAFRTPIKDSTGAAHIMEHSVFCGSEKFPLKEPFTNMMNQSVNTFLNAMTYSDKTVYPASSMNKKDYFNLFDVYADAVFFPLLKKEAFIQEGHRLEIDEKGEYSIQGVVYNEMKGNYSSFESVANDEQIRSLFPDTNYAYDSGGDPLEIPSLTYEAFKAFHKKYYRPDNCLLFLYGNISTEEQLDFLQENFLDRLEKTVPVPEKKEKYPEPAEEYVKFETAAPLSAPIEITAQAPDTGATGCTVTLNWLCGETKDLQNYIECAFLSEVLTGHDGSPVSKALIESDLGDDLAPITGVINETRNFSMALGLHGVKKTDAAKVRNLIMKTLNELVEKGIDRSDIDAALMSAEFSNREIVRAGGPYALVLLDRALAGWNYGRNPAEMLYFRDAIETIRRKIEKDENFVTGLISEYLLNNEKYSFVVVEPSKTYLKNRNKAEKKLLEKLIKTTDKQLVSKESEMLHAYQNHHETPEEVSCIPALNLSDLKTDVEEIKTEIIMLPENCSNVYLFKNEENTNGIAYFSVCFPVDVLAPEDYQYLPLFSYCATNVGWGEKDWAACASETAVKTGGIYSRLLTSTAARTAEAEKIRQELAPIKCTDRDWLIYTVRFINEKTEDSMKLFAECLSQTEFSDTRRIMTLTGEAFSAIKASIVPKGNRYAAKRALCTASYSCKVDEIWNGISQFFTLLKISEENPEELAGRFKKITEKLFASGAILHITADGETLKKVESQLPAFLAETRLKPVSSAKKITEEELEKMILLKGEENAIPQHEYFSVKSQVGFAASSFPGTFFGDEKNPSELVLAHWLSGNSLWERIRTSGGVYGAYAGSSNLNGSFNMATFRDPNPVKSTEVFVQCLKDAAETKIEAEECVRNITGTYGDEVQPRSPGGRGYTGFFRKLYCISDADRKNKIEFLLKVNPEQLQQSAQRILAGKDKCRSVIIGDKPQKNTGVIIELPL